MTELQAEQLLEIGYWIVGLLSCLLGILTAYGFWIGKIGGGGK